VSAGLPHALNQAVDAPTDPWRADRYTLSVNLAGLPALSTPCGLSSGDKPLPIGMQLIGNYFQEGQLLAIADCFQTHTDWHQRTPELKSWLGKLSLAWKRTCSCPRHPRFFLTVVQPLAPSQTPRPTKSIWLCLGLCLYLTALSPKKR